MTVVSPNNEPEPMSPACALLLTSAFPGVLALLFRILNADILFGSMLALFLFLVVMGIILMLDPDEPVVILSQLPDELRQPLQPFVRRGVDRLPVSEIRSFYRAAGEFAARPRRAVSPPGGTNERSDGSAACDRHGRLR